MTYLSDIYALPENKLRHIIIITHDSIDDIIIKLVKITKKTPKDQEEMVIERKTQIINI